MKSTAIKDLNLSAGQSKRLGEELSLVGSGVILRGTESTTKVQGVLKDIQSYIEGNRLKFKYYVLFEGYAKPIEAYKKVLIFNAKGTE
tara:strand:- start:978 stop:1241 length:264 start_codon:yes stop_codon:yes gene_type:complete